MGKFESTAAEDRRRTWIHCPDCRKSTYTHVRFGDVAVWCRHCRKTFEVVIRPFAVPTDLDLATPRP